MFENEERVTTWSWIAIGITMWCGGMLSVFGCNASGSSAFQREPKDEDVMLTFNAPPAKAVAVLNDGTVYVYEGRECKEALAGLTAATVGVQVHPTMAAPIKDALEGRTSCTRALIDVARANKALVDEAKKKADDEAAKKAEAAKAEETKK